MTIHIHKDRLISDIQQEFNNSYPFLKIELFVNRHGYRQPSPRTAKLPSTMPLKAVSDRIEEGIIELSDGMSVQELERVFNDRFGIHAQVFRRSGNLWLETTMTDNWTLKQQHDHGKEITLSLPIQQPYPGKATDNQ